MGKILSSLFVVFMILALYSAFKNVNTTSAKSKRLQCQNTSTTFESINFNSPIFKAISLLESNNIELKTNIEYSKIMPSNIESNLTIKDLDKQFKSVLKTFIKNNNKNENKLLIDYYLYENDKLDKGKLNKKAKDYAGYLVFEFIVNNQLVYKIQTDYLNLDASDLDNRMTCVLNSFITIK